MIETHTYPNATWVRLINPKPEELAKISETYGVDPEAIHDLSSPTPRQKIETYNNSIYAVFHMPAYKHSHTKSHLQEIDFIIGKDHIITVQYDTVDALQKFSKEAEAKTLIGKNNEESVTPGVIFVEVMHALYESLSDEILFMQDWLRKIEDQIFSGKEKQMVTELSRVGRDLLDLRRTLAPQKIMFENLLLIATKAKNTAFRNHVKSIYENGYMRIYDQTEHNMELATELRETNNSLVSTSQNEVMKTLTIMAFITFPLTLITSIFGMNTLFTPILGINYDFWIIFGFMFFATICMFIFFKYKKWL